MVYAQLYIILRYNHEWQLAPKGVLFVFDLISLVIAPLFVGLVLLLVEHWLDD